VEIVADRFVDQIQLVPVNGDIGRGRARARTCTRAGFRADRAQALARQIDLLIGDLSHNDVLFVDERRARKEHAEERDAQCPDINCFRDRQALLVGVRVAHLGRIEGGCADSLGQLLGFVIEILRVRFAQVLGTFAIMNRSAEVGDAEVRDLDPALDRGKQIRRLDVAMDDTLVVKVPQAKQGIAECYADLFDRHHGHIAQLWVEFRVQHLLGVADQVVGASSDGAHACQTSTAGDRGRAKLVVAEQAGFRATRSSGKGSAILG